MRQLDTKDGTAYFETELKLENPNNFELREGFTANSDIGVEVFRDALAGPLSEVVDRPVDDLPKSVRNQYVDPTKKFARVVYVFEGDKAITKPVSIGASDLTKTVILGGLAEGERTIACSASKVLLTLKINGYQGRRSPRRTSRASGSLPERRRSRRERKRANPRMRASPNRSQRAAQKAARSPRRTRTGRDKERATAKPPRVERLKANFQAPLMDAIVIQGLQKIYRIGTERVHELRGVDLTIKRNEFVASMESSRSGKSTLMNVLGVSTVRARLVPARGEVHAQDEQWTARQGSKRGNRIRLPEFRAASASDGLGERGVATRVSSTILVG